MKKTLGTKLLLAAVTLGVLAYFAVQAVRYLSDPLTTTLAYRYEVELATDLSGYVVREETVLPAAAGGEPQLQRTEGERVSAGGLVALVYADQAAVERQQEIQALETRIEQLQYAQEAALGAEVSLRLDSQILQSLQDYRAALAADRLDQAEESGAQLRSLVLKRDYTYSDSGDLSAQMAELRSQADSLRAQMGASTQRITAPEAGLYSAVVDGDETVLTPERLAELTPSRLAALEPDEAALDTSSVGKLVLGEAWYYAAVLEEGEAALLRESAGLKLRFAKGVGRDLEVELISVREPENGRVAAVFRGDTYLSELTLLRRQSAQAVLSAQEGLRVPRAALRVVTETEEREDGSTRETTVTGVYCVSGREAAFKPVEVLYSNESFALVRADVTADQELRRLRAGDEVIVSARDLYDGKVLE